MKKIFSIFLIGAVFTALLFSSPFISEPIGGYRFFTSDKNEILNKEYYVISYRLQYGVAEWAMYDVSYEQVHSQNVKRYSGAFRTDASATIKVTHKDYTNSNYDRGHLVPCNDMQWDNNAMMSTFYMTNVVPQTHALNAGVWKSIENISESFAEMYGHIWVITGPILDKPSSKFKSLPTSKPRVIIPEEFYKIFFAFDENDNPVVIAFIVPQDATNKNIKSYIVSVDEIEELTGLDFFSNFSEEIQNSFEEKPNIEIFN